MFSNLYMQADVVLILQNPYQRKNIFRTRIALRPKHSMQAFTLFSQFLGQSFEPYRRIHIVAHDGFPRGDIAVGESVDRCS